MPQSKKLFWVFQLIFLGAGLVWASAMARAQTPPNPPAAPPAQPLVSESALTQVSPHVYAIIVFPNIGIVVGSRATLVVDTGLGPRNGATVVRVVEKLAKAPNLYLTTTHFHPEHSMGAQAFPDRTVLIRPSVQQDEMDKRGTEFLELFRNMSPQNKELLQDVKLGRPDIVFDNEVTLDLGGVTARLFWLGAAHTKGDELIFVKEDSVLLPGDVVQNKLVPNMPNEDASPKSWIAILDKLEPLKPRFIVPDHGALGDGSLIGQERAFMSDVQGRALQLKRQGVAVDDAGQMLATEFKAKYPDWTGAGVPNIVRRVYAESQ
jgi:glyoxylase-like metal-dependent hydrolase (beta-lactamase superfamily II)